MRSVLNADLVGANIDNVYSPAIGSFLIHRIFELAEDPTTGEVTYQGGDRVYATANLHGALSAITISYSYTDPGNYMWVHTTSLDHPEN